MKSSRRIPHPVDGDECGAGVRGMAISLSYRSYGSTADVHASLLAGTATRRNCFMEWREAPGQKRMAICSADGSARSVRTIGFFKMPSPLWQ
jgi:hypothetical protein